MAPAMIAKVHTGNAKATTPYDTRSRARAAGSEAPSETGNRGVPPAASWSSWRTRRRYSSATTPDSRNAPEARIAAKTWILIQYESSAGTSGPAAV